MGTKIITIATVVFVVIVAGMFGYSFYQKSLLQNVSLDSADQGDQEPVSDRFSNIERIDAKHYFIDGTHTLVGELTLPTPCDLLEHEVIVAESYPEQISIVFSVLNNSDSCAQVLTTQRFMIEVSASEQASFAARFEGRQVDLNLIPAAEGETPDEFELYIKG